jgi:hypothetical protein
LSIAWGIVNVYFSYFFMKTHGVKYFWNRPPHFDYNQDLFLWCKTLIFNVRLLYLTSKQFFLLYVKNNTWLIDPWRAYGMWKCFLVDQGTNNGVLKYL